MTHFEPSKRLFLGNLAPDVTVKDIADFIKNRTKARPMFIEIAQEKSQDVELDENGKVKRRPCRGFAYATVEGLRGVIESLNGMLLNDRAVTAAQAKPHYSVAIRQRKIQAEKEEEARLDALRLEKEAWNERQEEMMRWQGEEGDTDEKFKVALRPPPSFYAGRQRYHQLGHDVHEKLRQEARARKQSCAADAYGSGSNHSGQSQHHQINNSSGESRRSKQQLHQPDRKRGRSDDRRKKGDASAAKPPAAAAPPPPAAPPAAPAGPSKEERKLASLQAKLAFLQQFVAAKK